MKRIFIYYTVFLLLIFFSCREKYLPKLDLPATSFLVVEGYINSAAGPTTIILSRTTRLIDTVQVLYETKALVRVEGKQNTAGIILPETARGKYSVPQLTLNPNDQYRVYIKTANGKEYVSDYSAVRRTPDIDSVTWKRVNGGLQLYAHTHDPQDKTRYYQYSYDETWEFRSRFISTIKTDKNIFGKPVVSYRNPGNGSPDTTMYRCWQSSILSGIVTATSEQLAKDVIANKPLQTIQNGSYKLSQLYTMLVKQRALSREAYNFLEQMKKNTEQLGSIFDAQPSDNNGNMRCLSNAAEIVLGFIEVTEEKQQRIWITQAELVNWRWDRICETETEIVNHPDSLILAGVGSTYASTTPAMVSPTGAILSIYVSNESCVDCRVYGSIPKPSFWP